MSKRQAELRKRKKFQFNRFLDYMNDDPAPIISEIYDRWLLKPGDGKNGSYRHSSKDYRIRLTWYHRTVLFLYFNGDNLELRVRVAEFWDSGLYDHLNPMRLLRGTISVIGLELKDIDRNDLDNWLAGHEQFRKEFLDMKSNCVEDPMCELYEYGPPYD